MLIIFQTAIFVVYTRRKKKNLLEIKTVVTIRERFENMKDTVQSIVRGLNVLEIVAEHNEISLKEISTLSGLNKATVHRLLSTLIATGYIEQVNKNGIYRPTYKLFSLGNKKIDHVDSYKIANRFISELSNTIEATVHLVIEDHMEVVYIDKIDPTNSHSSFILKSQVGKRAPMYCTAVGKVLLSKYPNEKIKEIWEATDIKPLTPKTFVNFEAFLEEINAIRSQGYALDLEENEIGVVCVGCEFYNHKGLVEGAISISVPIMYFESKADYYIKHVKECAANISKALGYLPTHVF